MGRKRSSIWGSDDTNVEPGHGLLTLGKKRESKGRYQRPKRDHRASNFTTTLQRGANGVARWFGVAGDEEDARYRQMQYRQHVQQQNQRQHKSHGHGGKGNLQQLEAIMEDSESDSDFDPEKHEHDMTRDVDEGLLFYRSLRDTENKKIVKPGWFGGEVNKRRGSLINAGLANRRESKHRRQSKLRKNTLIAAQLEAMPSYRPVFIELICFLQVIIFLFLMAYAYTEGQIAPFGVTNKITTCTADTTPSCELFNGTLAIGEQSVSKQNIMYGPTEDLLLHVGAKFAPCMRSDSTLRRDALATRAQECGPGRDPANACESLGSGYGCCTLDSGRKGMQSNADCTEAGGTWENVLCNSQDFIYLRPCCGARGRGSCEMTTENMCDFLGGSYQVDKLLCSDTLCLQTECQFEKVGLGITADASIPNLPDNPNQWYRFIISLFIHSGAIHCVAIVLVQWFIGRPIEMQAGALRVLLIYLICGICGNVIASIFTPRQVGMGANPAVYGLIGCSVVELVQTWQLCNRPHIKLIKVLLIVVFFLLIGTTSYLDNWSHIAGFAFGIVSGILFLPYVTFGSWDLARKRLLVFISFPLLIAMIIMTFVTFYVIQNTDFCSWCHYLNCIPYAPELPCDG
eukprot:m.85323 g.85323  ORF g.85323 m.85323 type:complete len:628 (+) comp12188_c0_seq1:148-2031(+)